ncbi:MAG: DUF1704 domain-containing protein [Myxococcales bacterium]|nr:DUF1704 domain-containing protein [Myxococcales bacterium]
MLSAWRDDLADAIEAGVGLLGAVGTPRFLEYGRRLYGLPSSPQVDGEATALELATRLGTILDGLCHVDLARHLRPATRGGGGRQDATLGRARLPRPLPARRRRAEPLIERDRRAQSDSAAPYRVLHGSRRRAADPSRGLHSRGDLAERQRSAGPSDPGGGHPGTTRTQEGLAVFAEFISGAMDVDRLRRLVDRVTAIQVAIDGADFLEVYRFFLEKRGSEDAAFEGARRVFRGGVLTGGAPFTKDVVYLDGLIRVHDFLRAAVSMGRSDCLHILFAGKLDLEHVPALCALRAMGLCRPPRFLPPWIEDMRFLVSYLAYASFLHRIDFGRVETHYQRMMADAPRIDASLGFTDARAPS